MVSRTARESASSVKSRYHRFCSERRSSKLPSTSTSLASDNFMTCSFFAYSRWPNGTEWPMIRWKVFVMAIQDRKSTRLNSSHRTISYAVFCLKKKKNKKNKKIECNKNLV